MVFRKKALPENSFKMREFDATRLAQGYFFDNIAGRHFEMSDQDGVIACLRLANNRCDVRFDRFANGAVCIRLLWRFSHRLNVKMLFPSFGILFPILRILFPTSGIVFVTLGILLPTLGTLFPSFGILFPILRLLFPIC